MNSALLEPAHVALLAGGEFPFVFLVTIGVVAIVILLTTWMKSRTAHLVINLKKSMVERGMSVEEMERVLVAGTGSKARLHRQSEMLPPVKPQAGPIHWPTRSHN